MTNRTNNSVFLWKPADLSHLGNISLGPGTNPSGACSDGVNSWIAFNSQDQIAKF